MNISVQWGVPMDVAHPQVNQRHVRQYSVEVHKDGIDNFYEHLSRQNVDIKFTKERESNFSGNIPFLDCLATCDSNRLRTTCRKPNH